MVSLRAHARCILFRHKHPTWALTNTHDWTTHIGTTILRHTEALRAYRVVVMICVLHVSNALRPVTTRCGNTNLGPAFGYQNRQIIIPLGGEFRARPVIQVDITIAVRQLQTVAKELARSRPPSPSRLESSHAKSCAGFRSDPPQGRRACEGGRGHSRILEPLTREIS